MHVWENRANAWQGAQERGWELVTLSPAHRCQRMRGQHCELSQRSQRVVVDPLAEFTHGAGLLLAA